MKMWKSMQKEGYIYTGLGREKPCKNLEVKRQKIAVEPCWVGEREESFENFLKKMLWTCQDLTFKKTHLQFSIDRKSVSIDQNRQKFIENFKRNFDWSKNRLDQSKI